MPYEINDVNGRIGHGPTITGLKDMKLLLSSKGEKSYPATTHFLVHGYTTKLVAMSVECKTLATKTTDKHTKDSFMQLAQYAMKASDTVYLHNGVS